MEYDPRRQHDGSAIRSPLRDTFRPGGPLHDVTSHFRRWSITLAVLVWSWTVRAEPPALELHWIAPKECPRANEVRKEVLRLVAPKTQFSSPIDATARTQVNGQRQYVLKLETLQAGVEGERVFTGRTCRAVTDAAIVTMALSLDPTVEIPKDYGKGLVSSETDAMPEARAPEPSASEARAPEAQPPEARPTEAKPQLDPKPASVDVRAPSISPSLQIATPLPREKIHGYVRGLLGWRWGSLPDPAGELGLGFGLRRARLSTQLTVVFSPSTRHAASHVLSNAGGTFSMQAAELTACGAIIDGTWSLTPCLGLAFTNVFARGTGVEPVRDGRLYWMSPQLALEASYRVSRLVALYLGGAGCVALERPGAYLGESERIFRPEPVAYRLAGGGELQIW